jgi:nicotinate-nucleotide pyrophosphorylase (carboxylating)
MNRPNFNIDELKMRVLLALQEDTGDGDVTTKALIPADARAEAALVARQKGVVCGVEVAREVFVTCDPLVRFEALPGDGETVAPGMTVARVAGAARAILTAERTALNFIQRLSGIATLTRKFVDAVEGTRAKICDTRKTTPGMRALEKYAVACGGGMNHRMGLYDGVLIKDNHIDICRKRGMTIAQMLAQFADRARKGMMVEIEARSLADVRECIDAGATLILLDNMSNDDMRKAVQMGRASGREIEFEASGNVTLERVREIALTGVQRISAGALTHSAPILDMTLLVETK